MPPTFHVSDLATIASLVLLEGLLSADNALVLALLVGHLRPKEQDRALWLGLLIAFGFRAIGIALAAYLISLWWVCGIGGAYLMFLTVKHFASKHGAGDESEDGEGKKRGAGFWTTVAQIGITDLFFAIDSILVAVALVHSPSKIWVVYLGGLLGILLLRVAAQALIGLIRKYPLLDNLAYLLVGWAGVKLGFESAHLYGVGHGIALPEMPRAVFWTGFVLIVAGGVARAVRGGPKAPEADQDARQSGQEP